MRLYCRPKLDGDATDPKHSVYSEVVERSLAVDRPKCESFLQIFSTAVLDIAHDTFFEYVRSDACK